MSEHVPCWYELVWRETKGMVLRIHTDLVNGVIPITNDSPIVQSIMEDKAFGFKEAGFIFGKDIGFNKALSFIGEQQGFLEYSVPTPLVRKNTGKSCQSCRGTGYDQIREDTCPYCDGERMEIVYDYSDAYAVSASLGLLFFWMRFPDIETKCSLPQLMSIENNTVAGPHGGSLYGEFSKSLVNFIRSLPQPCEIPSIASVMRAVWEKMDGKMPSFYDHSFRAYTQNDGRLLIDCPGDACGIHPNMGHRSEGGYEFSCHNTDQMLQQLTLFAGLAELQRLARSAGV